MTNTVRRFVLLLLILLNTRSLAAETLVVATHGDDQNPGSHTRPLLTIGAAAQKAMPGDTVLVLEGTYRERVTPVRGGKPGKPIVYRAQPGKRVFIKGSELWQPNWKSEDDGVFSGTPDADLFDDRSPEYIDSHNPFKVKLASTPWERDGKREVDRGFGGDPNLWYTCGQVFVNGQRYREVPYRKELADKHWFYDDQDGRIYIGFGGLPPAEQQVEITTRRRIFAPQKRGLGYVTVEGFILEHCGNQYPTNFWVENAFAQKGALGIEAGHHWIIRKNVIRLAKTFAIDCGYVDKRSRAFPVNDNLIQQNYVVDNGSAGILSNRSENLIIRDNVVLNNNTLRFFELKRWEQAGIKCHNLSKGHIHHNYIANNQLTYGIWLDNQFPDSRVSHNVIVNNDRAGIFLEMSDYGFDRLLVDHNVIVGNRENGVYIHDASGATFVHNLIANTTEHSGRGQAVYIRQVSARTKTYHHSFFNNLFVGNHWLVDVNYPSHRSGPQRFENNVYSIGEDKKQFAINSRSDTPSPWKDDEFIEMVSDELGTASPGIDELTGPKRAELNFRPWQLFWQKHDLKNDLSSLLVSGNRVVYVEATLRLQIDMGYDVNSGSSSKVSGLDKDFFDQALKGDGHDQAGPFQNLKYGSNEFEIWRGLPILAPGELPPSDFNL